MISSSVWSTLMTSSIRRLMLLAKRVLMGVLVVIGESSSEDLRSVVVLGVEHPHETQTSRAIEVARVEEHGRHVYVSLQLLKERERAVDGEQRTGAQDED